MEKQKGIIIYGAGRYASVLYHYLWIKGRKDQIVCFAVTDMPEQKSELYGIPIKKFEEIKQECMDAEVVIAIKQAGQVEDMLRQQGINKIYVITPENIETMRSEWNQYLIQLPIQRNKILFTCFAGKGYECNCKYIAEELLKENRPLDMVWCVSKKGVYQFPKGIRQVECGSPEYYTEIHSAAIMISNNDNAPAQKENEMYFINMWHGTGPFKKVNASIAANKNNAEWMQRMKDVYNQTDLFVSNSADNSEMFRESFLYDGEILECGSPRNDILFEHNDIRNQVCNQLNIDCKKKILLYAPTFRDDIETSFAKYTLDMKKVLQVLHARFGEEYILLYRFHHRLREYRDFANFYPFGINVTMYPDAMELVVAADVLITDYSSIMWDFSLQKRPVFLYHNDEKEYINDRDFYWPVSRWPYIVAHTSDEMCEKILSFDEQEYLLRLDKFFKEDPSYDDGHASERLVERIMDVMEHPEKYGKA